MGGTDGVKGFIDKARVPFVFTLAEINLTYILARNLVNFYLITSFIEGDELYVAGSVALILLNILSSLMAVKTMFGLPSSRRGAWRSTTRTLIALLLVTAVTKVLDLSYAIIDTSFIIIPTVIAIVIMFLPSVTRYHTPAMTEVPPLKDWIKALFILPEKSTDRYRFVYADDE